MNIYQRTLNLCDSEDITVGELVSFWDEIINEGGYDTFETKCISVMLSQLLYNMTGAAKDGLYYTQRAECQRLANETEQAISNPEDKVKLMSMSDLLVWRKAIEKSLQSRT